MKVLFLLLAFFLSPFAVFANAQLLDNTYLDQESESIMIIPDWIKNIALWYGQGQVSDSEFISAIEFLIENDILQIEKDSTGLTSYLQNPIDDKGDFYVTYHPNPNSLYEYSAKKWVQSTQYFETQVEYLNSLFSLPQDIEIILIECDEDNAFYDPLTRQIIMCYEFIDSVYEDFSAHYGEGATVDEINLMTFDVMDFVFYHELGHALVDVYLLPITGLEENSLDQFAAFFMLMTENEEGYEGIVGQDILYNVGTWFFIQNEKQYDYVFWDVHNLDIQRFYNISCYAYGQHPEYNQDLIEDGWLPAERALNCQYEYAVLEDSWTRILSPFYN